jgi:hypothetical protein
MKKSGYFSLGTVDDLFFKMERDLRRLEASPLDVDMAFNFFITAEHLLDWKYPGDGNKTRRAEERNKSVLLQIVWDLASGAKHFETRKNHKSVARTDQVERSYWPRGFWKPGYWKPGFWGSVEVLVIALEGDAAKEFGSSIDVVPLARCVLQYWKDHRKP